MSIVTETLRKWHDYQLENFSAHKVQDCSCQCFEALQGAELAEAASLLKAGYLERLKQDWLEARSAFLSRPEIKRLLEKPDAKGGDMIG